MALPRAPRADFPGVGETLAELIATGSTPIDLGPYSIARFGR
jgi:sarcosine oxidase subunit beta